MRHIPDKLELSERISLNYKRLTEDEYYRIGGVFSPVGYDWPGDKEGRALLAFMSHYKISGNIIECMPLMLGELSERTDGRFYFGGSANDIINEQQLSGHSWLLRGLCEHYEAFRDDLSLCAVKCIVENLYLPTKGRYAAYPLCARDSGGVSGTSSSDIDGWRLSSDIGCAFMSIDGLSHAYTLLNDERISELLDEMIETFANIDKESLSAQTHCSLTAARGMMRMHRQTKADKYLNFARDILELYIKSGMTLTYQNLNWWGRPDSWTEPCAVVDSLILALDLYKATDDEKYRRLASRIYLNGFASLQRDNGGAGTDSIVLQNAEHELYAQMYEAYFCCTMRLSEGLWYIFENLPELWWEEDGAPRKTPDGVYMSGDRIYAEISGGGDAYTEEKQTVDGHVLSPLLKYYKLPRDILVSTRQRIIF